MRPMSLSVPDQPLPMVPPPQLELDMPSFVKTSSRMNVAELVDTP